MATEGKATEPIIAFVRGQQPWQVLSRYGISLHIDDHGLRMAIPSGVPDVLATRSDVISGFRSHIADQVALREWAMVLNAADFIDITGADSTDREMLLDGVRDAAFGDPLSRDLLAAIHQSDEREGVES